MASRNNNGKKIELAALHRLEFYKNKQKWKLSDEKVRKPVKPVSESPNKNTKRGNKLNETYNIDEDKEIARPSKKGFKKDIPISPSVEHQNALPSTSKDSQPDLVSTPLLDNDVWLSQKALPSPESIKQDSPTHEVLIQQPSTIQNPDIWPENPPNKPENPPNKSEIPPNKPENPTNKPENPWPNSQPVDNLQSLLKTASLSWTQQPNPGGNQPSKYGPMNAWTETKGDDSGFEQNTWNSPAVPKTQQFTRQRKDSSHINQDWTDNYYNNLESTQKPLDFQKSTELYQKPFDPYQKSSDTSQKPSDSYQESSDPYQKLPDLYQRPSDPYQEPSDPYQKPFDLYQEPSDPYQKSSDPYQRPSDPYQRPSDLYQYQSDLQKTLTPEWAERKQHLPDLWPLQIRESDRPWRSGPQHWSGQMYQDITNNNQGYNELKEQHTWTCPPPPSNPEVSQVWTSPLWQKQGFWQNDEKEAGVTASQIPDDDEDEVCSELQYASEKPEYIMNQAQVLENTSECLQQLIAMYNEDNCIQLIDQQDGDDSIDFIREAHEVPHSSEIDPNEICECLWSGPSPASLSPDELSQRTCTVAQSLRFLLTERSERDRLRAETLRKLEDHPTRDMNLFGNEYVLSGSHMSHSTTELQSERIIQINMGRPYRLTKTLNY